MRRSQLAVLGLVAASAIALSMSACGSSTDTKSGTGGSAPDTAGLPPAPGPQKPGDGNGAVFAVRKLYLGDTNRDGSPNTSSGWKQYGFNIDGQVSTESSTNLCKPAAGGSKKNVYPDGNHGIDNSFGKNILPIIIGVAPDASTKVNEGIDKGSFTIILSIEKLGTGVEYNPLTTRLYAGADLGAAPKWDGTDKWPVVPELLNDPKDITSSKIVFNQSYLVDNTWVSGSKGTLNLSLGVSGYSLNLVINSALIAMKLAGDHKSATDGTIAGVINTEDFITELKKVAGAFDPSLCSGSTIDSIANQLRQASDIMADGSAGSPSVECDGISIGLGFDASIIQLGDIAPAADPKPNPCNGGGGGGTGGGGTGGAGGGTGGAGGGA